MTPMFLTLDGESRTGVVPVQLIVNGVATPEQLAEVRSYYGIFDAKCRTSLASTHVLVRTLIDGSKARFERRFDVDRVILDPIVIKKDERLKSPVAWPSYVDLAFSTIFDRPVIDLGSYTPPPYPPEPVYPTPPEYGVPEPTYTAPPSDPYVYWVNLENYDVATGRYTVSIRRATFSELSADIGETAAQQLQLDGGMVDMDGVEPSSYPHFSAKTRYTTYGSIFYKYTYGNGISTRVSEFERAAQAAVAAAQADVPPADNSGYLAYLAAHEAWANARNAYYADLYNTWLTTVHQAWVDACKAIDDAYPSKDGATLLKTLRTQARANQISALKEWLDKGIGNPHLTARYLSFPFTISTAHTGSFTLPAGTDIGHDQITDSTVNWQITHSVTDGNVNTVTSETYADFYAQTTMAFPSEWKMGGNVAKPTNLFGWLANGEYKRYKRYYPNHYLELAQTQPGDLSTLSFSTAPGYVDFVNSPIGATTARAPVINSDAFAPPGTVITLAQLEYEVYDPYVLNWVWMPSVDLRKYDSIWISSLGQYTIPAQPGLQSAGVSPRNVRVRRFLRQTRQKDWSWSAAADVPAEKLRTGTMPTFPLSNVWLYYPTTVVAAMNLHAGAKPKPVQEIYFPFAPEVAFPEIDRDLNGAAVGPWATNEGLFALVARALNHIYKVA